MDLLATHLSKIKKPEKGDKVYKDECMFSFDNPVSFFNYSMKSGYIVFLAGERKWLVYQFG